VANKPSFLTGGAGSGGNVAGKRGTEDLDFFIGDEALVAASGPGREELNVREGFSRSLMLAKVMEYIIQYGMGRSKIG